MGKKKGGFSQTATLSGQQQEVVANLLSQLGGERGVGAIGQKLGGDITQAAPYQQGLEALGGLLQGGYNPEQVSAAFQANVARPALEQFQQELAPTIQQSAVAAGGGRSSIVPARTSQAAERLQANLAGQLLGQLNQSEQAALARQQNAVGQALGYAQAPVAQQQAQLGSLAQLLGIGIRPDYQQLVYNQGKQGYGGAIGTALGSGAGFLFGGPVGAQVGGQLGGAIGQQF